MYGMPLLITTINDGIHNSLSILLADSHYIILVQK